jgi:hypothetical protein
LSGQRLFRRLFPARDRLITQSTTGAASRLVPVTARVIRRRAGPPPPHVEQTVIQDDRDDRYETLLPIMVEEAGWAKAQPFA